MLRLTQNVFLQLILGFLKQQEIFRNICQFLISSRKTQFLHYIFKLILKLGFIFNATLFYITSVCGTSGPDRLPSISQIYIHILPFAFVQMVCFHFFSPYLNPKCQSRYRSSILPPRSLLHFNNISNFTFEKYFFPYSVNSVPYYKCLHFMGVQTAQRRS